MVYFKRAEFWHRTRSERPFRAAKTNLSPEVRKNTVLTIRPVVQMPTAYQTGASRFSPSPGLARLASFASTSVPRAFPWTPRAISDVGLPGARKWACEFRRRARSRYVRHSNSDSTPPS